VAGRLFGVRGKRIEESEVVIFLTPRIARHGEAMHGMGERLQDEVRGFEDRRNASGLRLPARQMAPQRVPAGVGSGTGSSRKSY
jgi:type II secretory pathway component GspD/PulD (secretin)